MNTIAPTCPAELRACGVQLVAGPAAAGPSAGKVMYLTRALQPALAEGGDMARSDCRSRYSPERETPAWPACAQSVHLYARLRLRGSGGLPFEDDPSSRRSRTM